MTDISEVAAHEAVVSGSESDDGGPHGFSMVVFSGDLDRQIAAFIIANGAAAMELPVTMFFTFWGLNALRRDGPVPIANPKTTVEKMFGRMMPRGAEKLKLSHLNLGGLGTRMIKHEMEKKHVLDLPHLIQTAREQGVHLVACTMTMDLMGIRKEELLPGIEFGGVGTMVFASDNSRSTLFI